MRLVEDGREVPLEGDLADVRVRRRRKVTAIGAVLTGLKLIGLISYIYVITQLTLHRYSLPYRHRTLH